MPRKPKFRPVITRVKLNPEQAVLTCSCHSRGILGSGTPPADSRRVATLSFARPQCDDPAKGLPRGIYLDHYYARHQSCSTHASHHSSSPAS